MNPEIQSIFAGLQTYINSFDLKILLRTALLIFVGIPLVFLIASWLQKISSLRFSNQQALLVKRITIAVGFFVILISLFHEFGFSLTPLLGAAGILSIALGFASQTSVSNIISGLFLMGEQPFTVGDVIKITDITGEILAIDLLSIKLRTLDNKFIRIPNETIIKSQVINITRFPIRRVDLPVGVAYDQDLGKVREILLAVAHETPTALADPEPIVVFSAFGNSAIELTLMVWAQKQDFLSLKNQLFELIKLRFDENEIIIPFNQQTLHLDNRLQNLLEDRLKK